MFKKFIPLAVIATFAFAQGAKAQTNVQFFYDFGRGYFTTTVQPVQTVCSALVPQSTEVILRLSAT